MIALCGELEDGYDSTIEHLIWRQLKSAWRARLALAPHDYPTLAACLEAFKGWQRVFLIPPGRVPSLDFREYAPPPGDIVYVFGRPGDNLVRYLREGDRVISIYTPVATDMMAVSVVGIVLYEHGQQNGH